MSADNLLDAMSNYSITHLQVEAVTVEAINAVIEVANESDRPCVLRILPEQVGSGAMSPGYLGFDGIAEFVEYVEKRDLQGRVSFCRAGIAQSVEGANSLSNVKRALRQDLNAGISFFHIDASRKLGGARERSEQIELELELMRFISVHASHRDTKPTFEIGGSGVLQGADDMNEFCDYLDEVIAKCNDMGIQAPEYVAAHTGTAIRELSNIAVSPQPESYSSEESFDTRLAESADHASFRGLSSVAHDCDYMGRHFLSQLYQQGITIASFGEELGTHETQVFLQLCDATRSASIRQDFLSLALGSQAWKSKISVGSSASEIEKAILAAHHLFADEGFQSIKLRLERRCGAAGICLDQAIREAHKTRLLSILRQLGSLTEIAAVIS